MPRADGALETVLDTWREVLGQGDALTADSNFFLCGGDSLDLTRVLVRIRERLGVSLEARDAAQFSTPRKMAGCCVAAPSVLPLAPRLRCYEHPEPARFPGTAGQAALWLAEKAGTGGGLYNTAVVLQLEGPLQVAALERAVNAVLRHHELLRARLQFDVTTQRLFVDVVPRLELALQPLALDPDTARQHVRALAAMPFDLEQGPLCRFALVATGPGHWQLLVCAHHAVTDGWSGAVLLRHLAEAYAAQLHDAAWGLAGTEREFRRFCAERKPGSDADRNWWRDYLLHADRLPSWPPTGVLRWPFAVALEERVLDAQLVGQVQTAVRHGGVLHSAFFLTALRLALRALSGLEEIGIGMPVSVRNCSAQEAGVGYFVNLLVTRERVASASAARSALHAVQRNLQEALQRRNVEFPLLAQQLQPALLPGGNPWCDILFAWQNLPAAPPAFGGLAAQLVRLEPDCAQHPLKVEFSSRGPGIACSILYARELLTRDVVCALHAELQYQLAALAAAVCRSK